MKPVIEVHELTKIYAQGEAAMRALDGVHLDVHPGELMLLMGPSGSGKTTLLSIMGCILEATSGSVRIHGREIVGLPQKALPPLRLDQFGFVFQGFNLFPTLTALQNVALALDLKGIPARLGRGAGESEAGRGAGHVREDVRPCARRRRRPPQASQSGRKRVHAVRFADRDAR